MIRELSGEISKRIKAQQYVQNTYIIVKELVENSIDAGSTVIKIKIDDSITVEDDGSGIDDLENVGVEGNTSKEHTSYYVLGCTDSNERFSHGFRGQALSSIADLCDLEITSRSTQPFAFRKDFTKGTITRCARERGTTVQITNLFKSCPVRRSINDNNLKRDLNRVCDLIESYRCANKIHFTLFYKRKVFLNCCGYEAPREYFESKYPDFLGRYLVANERLFDLLMLPVSVKEGKQMMFFNKRPISNKRIANTIKSEFNLYVSGLPTFVLVVKGQGDINISVDKSEAIFPDESTILNLLRSEVSRFFSSKIYLGLKGAEKKTSPSERVESLLRGTKSEEPESCNENASPGLGTKYLYSRRSMGDTKTGLQDIGLLDSFPGDVRYYEKDTKARMVNVKPLENTRTDVADSGKDTELVSTPYHMLRNPDIRGFELLELENTDTEHSQSPTLQSHAEYKEDSNSQKPNIPDCSIQNLDFEGLVKGAYSFFEHDEFIQPKISFSKEDFARLGVIGQFNNGFIITKLERDGKTYLIVVDQHAADEIRNFETIKKTFYLRKQRVITPVKLNLTPVDEMVISDNLDLFRKNGFTIENNMLETVPIYKNEVFGIKEFYDFLEDIKNEEYDFKKVRDIVASKACRSSVMIGDELSMNDMEQIVRNLAALEAPWKCPHGRPTFMVLNESVEA